MFAWFNPLMKKSSNSFNQNQKTNSIIKTNNNNIHHHHQPPIGISPSLSPSSSSTTHLRLQHKISNLTSTTGTIRFSKKKSKEKNQQLWIQSNQQQPSNDQSPGFYSNQSSSLTIPSSSISPPPPLSSSSSSQASSAAHQNQSYPSPQAQFDPYHQHRLPSRQPSICSKATSTNQYQYNPLLFHNNLIPPSPSSSSQHHYQQHQTNQSDEIEVLTQSLAHQLEKLANANADGLLDDDQYRTLRKGLFDQINASNQKPVLNERPTNLLLSTNPSPIISSSSEAGFQQQIPNSYHSLNLKSPSKHTFRRQFSTTLRSTPSTRSTSSFLHMIFQRQSRQANLNESIGPASVDEQGMSSSTRAGSISSNLPSETGSSTMIFRDLSRKGDPSLNLSRVSSLATSIRSGGGGSGGGGDVGGGGGIVEFLQDSNGSGIRRQQSDYRQIEWTTEEIRQEIKELELERQKLLETFDEMEKNLIAKYRAVPRSGPAGPVTKLEELDSLLLLNQQSINNHQHPHNLASATSTPESHSSQPMLMSDSDEHQHHPENQPTSSSASRAKQQQHRPTSFLAPLLDSRNFKPKTKLIYREMRMGGRNRQASRISGAGANENHGLAMGGSLEPASGVVLLQDDDQTVKALRSDPSQESELEIELRFLVESKLKVSQKYQDRLVYLRAKLKGAMIRELSS